MKIVFNIKQARNFLTKYKSHIILAVLVGVGSFLLGHTVAYNNNLNWVYYNGNSAKELISNFRKTYDKQQEIALNYQTAYQGLLDCMLHKPDCDTETSSQKQLELSNKRNTLVDELDKLDFETEKIMAKFSLR